MTDEILTLPEVAPVLDLVEGTLTTMAQKTELKAFHGAAPKGFRGASLDASATPCGGVNEEESK